MEISAHRNSPATGIDPSPKSPESPANSFAAFFDPAFGNLVVADSSPAGQDSEAAAAARKDIDFIRQNGLLAFIEENHKRKLEELKEELRAEILGNMGHTEESLAQMSADQRSLIEKMIAELIQQRLAAEAALNGGYGDDKPLDPARNPSLTGSPAAQAGL